MSKKLYIGPRLRRLREQHQLNQAQCAQQLGLSHSYLNQLENNQRPVSAAVLVKLSTAFHIDVAQFSSDQHDHLTADIVLASKDPVLAEHNLAPQQIQQLVDQQPEMAAAMAGLFHQYARIRQDYEQLIQRFYGEQHTAHLTPLPHEQVRDFFYQRNNYIDELDRAAEALAQRYRFEAGHLRDQLQHYLHKSAITLEAAEQLPVRQQIFQMASHIALVQYQDVLDDICRQAALAGDQANELLRIGLANYFAGALLMPYRAFLQAAEHSRYDIEYLEHAFQVSSEQVCHRLSTLQRRDQQGVPFYFVRVDQAGNISKRQSATSFHFARTGGACPIWNIHEAVTTPQKVLTQVARMPDGQRYFCIAKQVVRGGGHYHAPSRIFAIGLGCELQHAHRLVYADGLNLSSDSLVDDIGPGCRVCERKGCPQRAFPAAGKTLSIRRDAQPAMPYDFD
ncbi:short-chain fatty acyl-CoA regulator family protein [Bacterioplanoides pacificum]|uniref:Short-chain fatty acyl-CoA regulator family protein n=1 Tax=Bacterioplanoides pacificum TaxID=1171596 RepID=A0ABV7VRN6_9GAMM